MLIQFRFKNFKSFRDDTILDLSATKITEHSQHITNVGNEKILPVAAIYGANASGKSNVIKAFEYMRRYVMESFIYGGTSEENNLDNDNMPKFTPFLFDKNTKEGESLFEVYYVDVKDPKEKTYNYGFTLNKTGVVEEWLNVKAKTAKEFKKIFYRNGKELALFSIPSKNQENIKIALEKETLVVSLGAKLKIEKLKMVREWFLKNFVINFGDCMENMLVSHMIPEKFDQDKEVQKNLVNYLATFDPSIVAFKVEKKKQKFREKEREYLKIDTVHKMIGGGESVLPLNEESDGTNKMFGLYSVLKAAVLDGGVLLIDELNDRLHPLLVRTFLQTFLNKESNPKAAQIIFTTHDTWQLDNNTLRRDEIWFTEKDTDGVSSLYSLADFEDPDGDKIRKDENYEKNYLLGKYGAIPTMKHFRMVED